jgi:hypothetical protein
MVTNQSQWDCNLKRGTKSMATNLSNAAPTGGVASSLLAMRHNVKAAAADVKLTSLT